MDRIHNLPKIDLHCHLDGSLEIEFLHKVSGLDREDLIREVQVNAKECNSLSEYLEKFDLPISCLKTPGNIRDASYSFVKNLVSDNVKYVEVRFSPALLETETLHARDIIECVIDGLTQGYQDFSIRSNVIICAMRHHPVEKNIQMFKLAKEYLGNGVCAVDLAGDEARFPMYLYKDLFSFANREHIPFTIHAGECGNADNIREAVELGASRIGHGIAMRGNKELQALCRDKHIGIEMCPISNLQTRSIESIKQYPLREFLNNGLCATVNTDNRTVSNTSITKEFNTINTFCGFSYDDLLMLSHNSVNCSFAEDCIKQELLKLISAEYQNIN